MDTRFDQLSKVLGSDVSRRTALKFVGASVLGAMLSAVGVRKAEANRQQQRACKDAGDPACFDGGCHGTADPIQCGCVPKVRHGVETGKGMCHQSQVCSGLTPCQSSRECKTLLGKNWRCANSCCGDPSGSVSLCLPKCGTVAAATRGGGKTSLG